MSNKILLAWAIAASAIALVLLGVLIGRSSGTEALPVRVTGGYDRSSTDSGIAGNAAAVEPDYVVPEVFKGLPSEWRTVTDSDTLDGYAILFDPQRREVIVEQCLHRGYLTKDGSPLDTNYEFCDGVLWASILNLGDAEATVRARTGEIMDLDLKIREDGDQQLLSLSFAGHEMELIPGSKNDLLQAMDNTPQMIAEKQKQFEAVQAQYKERVRAQQAAANENEQEIPTYTLPASATEADEN